MDKRFACTSLAPHPSSRPSTSSTAGLEDFEDDLEAREMVVTMEVFELLVLEKLEEREVEGGGEEEGVGEGEEKDGSLESFPSSFKL